MTSALIRDTLRDTLREDNMMIGAETGVMQCKESHSHQKLERTRKAPTSKTLEGLQH